MSDEISRLSEVDNRTRKMQEEIDSLRTANEELRMGMEGLMQQAYSLSIQLFTQQIMSEALPRYLAGYKPGDYSQEIESNRNAEVSDPEQFKMLVSDPNFDEARYKAICKEVANIFMQVRNEAIKKANAEHKAPEAKPSGIITPHKKIHLV